MFASIAPARKASRVRSRVPVRERLLSQTTTVRDVTRQPFAHDAVLSMEADADLRAPGAAITVALCGHWEHEPPCPLAAHHTAARRVDEEVHLRTLFAAEPAHEGQVRDLIRAALAAGRLVDGDGHESRWHLRSSTSAPVRADEGDHARRLAAE